MLEPDALQPRFETTIKVGVISLRAIGLTERIDYVQKEFDHLNTKFHKTFDATTQQLDQKFEDIFGEKGKVSEVIDSYFGENGKITKEIFDPMKDGSPLYELRTELQKDIQALRTELKIAEVVKEGREKTPQKGYDFEAFCEEILAKIARQYGDVLERTSEAPGDVKQSRKGDFVIAADGRRIVFEVKDVGRIAVPQIHDTLDEAIKNRQASYGVFLTKYVEALPQCVGWLNEYSGDKLVCALSRRGLENEELYEEIICIAYKWARTKVALKAAREVIDTIFVRDRLSSVRTKLRDLGAILTQCRNVEKASGEIRTLTQRIQTEINSELSSILNALGQGTVR